MLTIFHHAPLGRWLLVAVGLMAFRPIEPAWAEPSGQKQVLVLYSTRRDAQIVAVGERELPRALEKALPEGLDYYSEFIDQSRFSQEDYLTAFRDFLRLKYGGHVFDIILAMDNSSLEFLDRYRTELFPDTPVVFFSSRPSTVRLANSTGVSDVLNFSASLDLMLAMQPDVRHVFVISGTDRTYERLARGQFQRFESRLSFTYLSGLATEDLEARLARLPKHSIIYYLHVTQDGDNENFNALQYLDRIAAVANAPIYCWADSAMGRGIVGGSLRSLEAQADAVAAQAVRVLRGTPADSIPLSLPDLNTTQVDWRQLRRWGISETRVPAGTLVRFREPSSWDRYKVYILSALTLLVAQTALIAGLLIQRTRRREAEEQLRGNQKELLTSSARIRDLGSRLLNAQETERARIARELHDDISQQMALMTIDLELLGGSEHPQSERLAAEALTRAHDISRSLHDLSHRLHPAKLRLIGLVGALQSLRHELSKSEIAIEFTHDNVPSTLPPDLTLCLFRIVQEALQNALKYSRAHEVSAHLSGNSEELTLVIQDDGVGFDVDAAWGSGLGLISMRERLEAIGGTLEIRSKPAAGTRLEVKVPLNVTQRAKTTAI